jgi:cobalt-zinc-cadmium efflux system membrane fusion protein
MDEQILKTEKQGHSRGRYVAVAFAAVVVLLGVLLIYRQDARTDETRAATPPKSASDIIEATPDQLAQINVEPVREQVIDLDLETTGKVGFNEDRMTPVFAPYGGRVMEVLVNKGDVVRAGQPLLVIDSPDLVAALNDLTEARSNVDKARIALDAAEKAAERARNLHSLEALATKELQAAEADLARAREDYRRATAAASLMTNKLSLFGKTSEEIKQLENSIAEQIDRRIEVRAPLSGTIVDRKVGPGQYIKSDTPDPLYLIGDLSIVWVNADVYETQLPYIRPGSPVTITVAAYPDRQFPARISGINPTVDPATRVVHVRCLVPNSNGLLKPEMFASIRIGNAQKRKVLVVPSTAVFSEAQNSFVLREEANGRFRRWQVKPGREIQGYTVVEDGLNSNDRVVTSGALLLSNGLAETSGK